METFWRLGYEGASIVDLTAAMGITPQSLYGAFGSKAALYREALKRYCTTAGGFAARALREEPTVAAAFGLLLRGAAREFTRSDRPHGCMLSTGFLTSAAENQEIAAVVTAMRAEMLAGLTARIERGKREGDLRPDTDAAALARYLQAVLQGMSVQAQDGADEAALIQIAAVAEAVFARYGRTPDRP